MPALLCRICIAGVAATLMLLAASPASAQAEQEDYIEWLNRLIREITSARVNQRSNTNQAEAPTVSGNTTSLVDQSSASDLVGLALNLAGLGGGTTEDARDVNAISVTVSAYALYAALRGADHLDPAFYSAHRAWRNVSFTLGFENDEEPAPGAEPDRATLAGVKVLLWNRRDASHPCYWNPNLGCYSPAMKTLQDNLVRAAGAFSRLDDAARVLLYRRVAAGLGLEPLPEDRPEAERQALTEAEATQLRRRLLREFSNAHLADTDRFQAVLRVLGPEGQTVVRELLEERIAPFQELDEASIEAVEAVRRAPQISIAALTRQSRDDPDEYRAEAIFDYGVAPRVNFTANGAFLYRDNKIGMDLRGGSLGLQFRLQLTPERRLAGPQPVTLSGAFSANWIAETDSIYKGQFKLTIPIVDGLNLPVSFTYANRTALIDETEVRGQFGFTFDLSRLMALYR